MLSSVLSERLYKAVSKIPYNNLCELRLRVDNPVVVNILGENYYLNDNELFDSLVLLSSYNLLKSKVYIFSIGASRSKRDSSLTGIPHSALFIMAHITSRT